MLRGGGISCKNPRAVYCVATPLPTCFPIFALIKFMSFGSTLIYPHEEFLIPRPPRTRSKFNPQPPRTRTYKAMRFPHPPQMRVPLRRTPPRSPKRFYMGGKSCACFSKYPFFDFQVIFYGQMALICNSILFEINCD